MTAFARWLLLLPASVPGLTGCAMRPRDPFVVAERALRRDDLLGALGAYDTVPVVHPRYPEARAAAVEIEVRMRRCHELILEALLLRGEWRDREALAALQRAREQWPTEPSLAPWIEATERRLALFANRERTAPSRPAATAGPTAVPLLIPDALAAAAPLAGKPAEPPGRAPAAPGPAPAAVDGGPPATSAFAPARGPAVASDRPSAPTPGKGRAAPTVAPPPVPPVGALVAVGEDPVAAGLVAVEGRLGRGDLEGAVGDLIELSSRFPDDARVRVRLGRLLNQRALLAYGQGALAAAIADWRRVLDNDPDNRAVQDMLAHARAELARAGNGN